jgi:hypothetical protein
MMSSKGGQGWIALGSSAFELGEQTVPRSSDLATCVDLEIELTGVNDGLWQKTREGLRAISGVRIKWTGAGLRAAKIRGADSPRS